MTQKGVGERVDELWRQIQRQQAQVLGWSQPAIVEVPVPALNENRSAEAALSSSSGAATTSAALLDLMLESPRPARKPRFDDNAQLSLPF